MWVKCDNITIEMAPMYIIHPYILWSGSDKCLVVVTYFGACHSNAVIKAMEKTKTSNQLINGKVHPEQHTL